MTALRDIPLRQRKKARKRLALLDAFLERLRHEPMAEITVKELCEAVEVSEWTFFNYFPRKSDLFTYFVRLWSIEMTWQARRAAGGGEGLATIEAFFDSAALVFEENPRLLLEMAIFIASEPQKAATKKKMISRAERLLRFPDLEGIEDIPQGNITTIFSANLEAALAAGELPEGLDVEAAILNLEAIFYGVPMRLAMRNIFYTLAAAYHRQLNILWAGL
ncbi:MAG: TetR/AcrR family transcriptional regulator, partial [Deltaproteobacteria bacterium]|nr:TetR/AcrR family transcriptional regulator [Deltaproteobacteria bacterium]